MPVPRDALLLCIFVGEDKKFEQEPLYQAIVRRARAEHLAGATVAQSDGLWPFKPIAHD
jgi:uncharacterized protein